MSVGQEKLGAVLSFRDRPASECRVSCVEGKESVGAEARRGAREANNVSGKNVAEFLKG